MLASVAPSARAADKLNVVFIAVDDLRPELACYGHPHMKTPHLDRLAREGLLFERAYCQVAVCNPSRNSVLSTRLCSDAFPSTTSNGTGYTPRYIATRLRVASWRVNA